MVYSLQETTDGGLKVTLISKNARLVSERAVPTSSSLSVSSSTPPFTYSTSLVGESSKPVPPTTTTSSQTMFSDEESTPFFRRLAFSTDGALLVTPAGQY